MLSIHQNTRFCGRFHSQRTRRLGQPEGAIPQQQRATWYVIDWRHFNTLLPTNAPPDKQVPGEHISRTNLDSSSAGRGKSLSAGRITTRHAYSSFCSLFNEALCHLKDRFDVKNHQQRSCRFSLVFLALAGSTTVGHDHDRSYRTKQVRSLRSWATRRSSRGFT